MKSSLMLRIAAGLTLLYCAGHTLGMPWTPSTRPSDIAVLEAMKTNRFDVAGSTRTYWDFYFGFGLAITGYLAVQAIVLWQLAPLAKNAAMEIRPVVAVFLIAFAANAIIVWRYFFVIPLVFAIAITTCLALAFVFARPAAST